MSRRNPQKNRRRLCCHNTSPRAMTLIVSVIGLVQTRGVHDPEGRHQALVGNALGVVVLLVVFGAASTGGDAPRNIDITIDR